MSSDLKVLQVIPKLGYGGAETGCFDIAHYLPENNCKSFIVTSGVEIAKAEVRKGVQSHMFNAPKGKRSIELTLTNLDFNAPFSQNPAVAAVKITKKTDVAKVDPRTGKAQGKSWTVNPIGVSAILIPPPCPKKITGVGIVTSVVVSDPGNGWTPPIEPGDPSPSYPVNLELKEILPVDGGGIMKKMLRTLLAFGAKCWRRSRAGF